MSKHRSKNDRRPTRAAGIKPGPPTDATFEYSPQHQLPWRSTVPAIGHEDRRHPRSIAFVSTYPPTLCGIATFTRALRRAIAVGRDSLDRMDVVSLVDARSSDPASEVVFEHLNGDQRSVEVAARTLNGSDVVVIQHEFGIYGGVEGAEVLDLVSSIEAPTVVVLHTVPRSPNPEQRRILESLVRDTDRTIVLSQSARNQLVGTYLIDQRKVTVVPHGAKANQAAVERNGERPLLLTWGLIGPGKGLETAIEAVADLKGLRPLPRYLILGETHPKIHALEGEDYRQRLIDRVHELELDEIVMFDNRYVDPASLHRIVRSADIVVLPYDSTEQVSSGVLVEAIAAGKPVVATDFPHAVEMLATGAGVVVPHGKPSAMASALTQLLTHSGLLSGMAAAAKSAGASLDWAHVASTYEDIFDDVVSASDEVLDLTEARPLSVVPEDLTKAG